MKESRTISTLTAGVATLLVGATSTIAQSTYTIVDTGQDSYYDNSSKLLSAPAPGEPFFGQDAQYDGVQPAYADNSDGTVTDVNTGLMWQKTPDFDTLRTWSESETYAQQLSLAGHDDWRVPTIKELYSLIDFRGGMFDLNPYIDTSYFDFEYPDPDSGLRDMDAQYWSSNEYVGTTMNGDPTVFGVNFADGRIKGYPKDIGPQGEPMARYIRCVRGGDNFGINQFTDNGDGTITDTATGLMWQTADSAGTYNWEEALAHAEDLATGGHDDWRLPNAKELQSIVDYTRAPDATDPAKRGPAIDPIFSAQKTESYCWSSTTHLDGPAPDVAVYLCFGQAWGYMGPRGSGQWMNVHGAGAQRSDPKAGDPSLYPYGRGPQGDDVRIYNYVRAVRNAAPPKDAQLEISPDPLVAGEAAQFDVRKASENSKTWLLYSTKGLGSTYVAALKITIDLKQPKRIGSPKKTDATGNVSWTVVIPSAGKSLAVWLQAVQFQIKTNVVQTSIQ